MKTEELNKTQRRDLLYVDPKLLMLEENFNTRVDYGDLNELKNSIIENGVKIPLRGYKEGEKYVVNDGHRRYLAVMLAIKEGNEIARVPFISEKKKNIEERIFEILLSNDGKSLTPLELGETYKRLQNYGFSPTEIAKRIGKSVSHVTTTIELAGSSKEVKDAIKEGSISATLVNEIKKSVDTAEEAEEIIKVTTQTNKEAGKKVTKKDLKGLIPEKPAKKGEPEGEIEEEPLHIPEKTKVREYSNEAKFTEKEVADLLKRQIIACSKSAPDYFRKKILDTPLVF